MDDTRTVQWCLVTLRHSPPVEAIGRNPPPSPFGPTARLMKPALVLRTSKVHPPGNPARQERCDWCCHVMSAGHVSSGMQGVEVHGTFSTCHRRSTYVLCVLHLALLLVQRLAPRRAVARQSRPVCLRRPPRRMGGWRLALRLQMQRAAPSSVVCLSPGYHIA